MPFHWHTKGFKCFYCNKHMRDCESLKEHTLTKHQNIDLAAFVRQRIITKDVPVKMDVTNLCCNVCPQELTSVDDLTAHIIAIHGAEYDPSIGICIFPFILSRDIMQCVLCPTKNDNFMSMVMHMYKEHIQHSYMCQICGLSFINKLRLNRHVTLSHIGHKCTICKRFFDAFHKLEKHKERIHGHVRSFECSLCSAKFDNNYQVKVHMGKIHNVEKYRIKCELCPKITTTKGAMVLHMQSMHSDIRYSCDLCDYKTGIKWMIKLHKRKHFGEKSYTCSVCDRKFGRSSNVRAHMKVHTGNVGRVCRWCRYGFTDLESLNKHEMEMHYYNQYT